MQRKTKIIATLGPAVDSLEQISRLVEAGMDAARMNFSHGTADVHKQVFEWVHQAAEQHERAVTLLQDIQGPKIRVGSFPDDAITLEAGQEVRLLSGEEMASVGEIYVGYLDRVLDLRPGSQVLLSDGRISLEVAKLEGSVFATVIRGGELRNRQGAALKARYFADFLVSTGLLPEAS